MKFFDFTQHFAAFPIITRTAILKAAPDFQHTQFTQWLKKGYIKRIANGYYMLSDHIPKEHFNYYVANVLTTPSYVSLESALSHYGLIPEATFAVTSITTKHKKKVESSMGSFLYSQVQKDLYFGYTLQKTPEYTYLLATPEKALLDFFYLNPSYTSREDMESLRIQPDIFKEIISLPVLENYVQMFHNKQLAKRIQTFLHSLDYAPY